MVSITTAFKCLTNAHQFVQLFGPEISVSNSLYLRKTRLCLLTCQHQPEDLIADWPREGCVHHHNSSNWALQIVSGVRDSSLLGDWRLNQDLGTEVLDGSLCLAQADSVSLTVEKQLGWELNTKRAVLKPRVTYPASSEIARKTELRGVPRVLH